MASVVSVLIARGLAAALLGAPAGRGNAEPVVEIGAAILDRDMLGQRLRERLAATPIEGGSPWHVIVMGERLDFRVTAMRDGHAWATACRCTSAELLQQVPTWVERLTPPVSTVPPAPKIPRAPAQLPRIEPSPPPPSSARGPLLRRQRAGVTLLAAGGVLLGGGAGMWGGMAANRTELAPPSIDLMPYGIAALATGSALTVVGAVLLRHRSRRSDALDEY